MTEKIKLSHKMMLNQFYGMSVQDPLKEDYKRKKMMLNQFYGMDYK